MGRWARKPVNHTSWVALVTPTDRPKSVCNRCLIELFCGVVCVVTLPFWHFCWCRGFCHRTESDLFLFLCKNMVDTVTLIDYCKSIRNCVRSWRRFVCDFLDLCRFYISYLYITLLNTIDSKISPRYECLHWHITENHPILFFFTTWILQINV